jgi:hypothetical protein
MSKQLRFVVDRVQKTEVGNGDRTNIHPSDQNKLHAIEHRARGHKPVVMPVEMCGEFGRQYTYSPSGSSCSECVRGFGPGARRAMRRPSNRSRALQ